MYRNLTDDVDEDVLSQTFGEFGTMEKVRTVKLIKNSLN